jgi:hypothetical protein
MFRKIFRNNRILKTVDVKVFFLKTILVESATAQVILTADERCLQIYATAACISRKYCRVFRLSSNIIYI